MDSKRYFAIIAIAITAGLVLMSTIAAPVAASNGKDNALEDRGEEGETDTGLCEADQQVHENTGGFGSDQDKAFHEGTTKGGFPVSDFVENCPHLGGGN
jgi:hypothetical protein